VAGIDEAGRGPLAGPVVAAAVVLPADFKHRRLNDSKALPADVRAEIYEELTAHPGVVWAFAEVDAGEIDRINILRATHEAMRRALGGLACQVDHALIDGLPVHPFPVRHTALVSGDAISLSIAAASVIAKVTRDRIMEELHALYPQYGFAQHKGYATRQHLAKLLSDGPCPIHRFSFSPVSQPDLAFASSG
jgi:ribonuclease HII